MPPPARIRARTFLHIGGLWAHMGHYMPDLWGGGGGSGRVVKDHILLNPGPGGFMDLEFLGSGGGWF